MHDKRKIVLARRDIGARITGAFMPLERSAQDTATRAAQCVATMLETHAEAGLPPEAGTDIIEALSEAARLAAQSRNKVMEAHGMLRTTATSLDIAFSDPDCPPNSGTEKPPFRIVA